ncbi:DNA polymerase epsilon subunit B [Linum grandiflorum]
MSSRGGVGNSLRKSIQKKFKIRGYALKVDALEEVLSFVNRYQDAEDEALELLLDHLLSEPRKLGVKSSIIEKELVSRAVSSLLEADEAVEENPNSVSPQSALRVIDAFSIPKYRYHSIKKQFYQCVFFSSFAVIDAISYPLIIMFDLEVTVCTGMPVGFLSKVTLQLKQLYTGTGFFCFCRECNAISTSPSLHLNLIFRTMEVVRCIFTCFIAPIQSLIGKTGTKWVMGLISQLEDGHFFLEDLTASVEIDFSKAISFSTSLLATKLCHFVDYIVSYLVALSFVM